ncbi:rbr family ring finger and ibr domain-containing [Holotrichia oblita]|uniref:Rbr family ring finger and ibr domain-containing n=1 Tax=Holotrichia oblita TaxID=644536 RepID=A0ACB9TVB3_HOLOL|nr:rbr family ring finger and ibr domain-containing [Holotrichia oblita]
MTLPIQPLYGDNSQPLRGTDRNRRRSCLSAAWADTPARKEKRRAICSWSVGYGTLTEYNESPRKVANSSSNLLETSTRGRILTNSIPIPHAATTVTSSIPTTTTTTTTGRRPRNRVDLLTMPGLKSLVNRRRNSGSGPDTSAPLVKRDGSYNALVKPTGGSLASLRKCETVLALTTGVFGSSSSTASSAGSMEPLQPFNRLRTSPPSSQSRICSRCSSLLTLASSSRYSLNTNTGGFVQVPDEPPLLCKLCLSEVPWKKSFSILHCGCSFCSECMRTYVEFEIAAGAYDISCPDTQCPSQGVLKPEEIKKLVGDDLLEKHRKYRLNREIEIDKNRTWCPQAGCETVCTLCPSQHCQPQSVHCPTCTLDFCSSCKLEWHPDITCEENNKQLTKQGKVQDVGIPFNSDLIKCCPMCNVPIEKDEGCAQMMCKRCKHVFCWYCLASLDDDFLLRHYDRGPCKNKLGHSRASVIWHRTQVIGIFAGFGILLLVASPLLLLAAPCIVCCKCRFCNAGTSKLDNEEELPGENS